MTAEGIGLRTHAGIVRTIEQPTMNSAMIIKFERKDGKWIQCHEGEFRGHDRYIRRDMRAELEMLPTIKPNGFEACGRFYC